MGRLADGLFLWGYSKLDQTVIDFMFDWAVTLDGSNTMYVVFATPDNAFAEMRKVLAKQRSDSSDIDDIKEYEQEIPLPFYSINRMMPVYDTSRAYAGRGLSYYKAQQITCNECEEIISLATYNSGTCDCGADISSSSDVTFTDYDASSKTETEADADEWHFQSSTGKPEPFTIMYEINLWTDTKGERDFNIMNFTRQFHQNNNPGILYLDVDYPEPMGTVKAYCTELEYTDNSDLEPGEGRVNHRVTFQFNSHCWLPPAIDRVSVVKTLKEEFKDYDTEDTYHTIDNVFEI